MTLDHDSIRRIMVRANNWIGDVVMISPSLRARRESYPSARIEVVAGPHVADCFTGHPWIDEVVLQDPRGRHRGARGFLKLAAELRERRYDLAVLFQKAFGAALLAFAAKVPRRVGFDTDQKRAAVGIGHAGENADYFTREIFISFLLGSAPPIFVSAYEFQKLSTFPLEKESDFFSVHGAGSSESSDPLSGRTTALIPLNGLRR